MSTLLIEATDETPKIILDRENNLFELSGRSLPEDVTSFYAPVLGWLDSYIASPNPETTIQFKMDYFNTASSKIILDILLKLEEIAQNGGQLSVKWFYKTNDLDMKEAGEEYSEIVEVPFEHISY